MQREYGDADTWHIESIDLPEPGKGEVRVRIDAAAIDHGTWHLMTGTPLMARPAFGLRKPRQPIPGRDLAGVVDAVGSGITDLSVGDRVIGTTAGTLATHIVVPRKRLIPPPQRLTPIDHAALPISGLTALQAVDAARLSPGSSVLVIGASGGVGHYVVQVAAALGAHVTAVCSASKAEIVANLGAERVLDRHTTDPVDLNEQFDAVIDIAGGRSLRQQRALTTLNGTIVFVGDNTGGRFSGGYFRPMGNALRMLMARQRYVMLASREDPKTLARLVALVDDGAVTPHVHRVYPLEDAATAMQALSDGRTVGKIVIVPHGDEQQQ